MSLLLKLGVFALCAYAAILLAAYLGQRRLMYLPDRIRTLPAEEGLADVAERMLEDAGRRAHRRLVRQG